jgi:tetratricopeptide (TPR) repeat protein
MISYLLVGFLFLAQDAAPKAKDWQDSYEAGKQAYRNRDYAEAAARLAESLELAQSSPVAVPGMMDMVRLLASVRRLRGEYGEAEKLLQRLSDVTTETSGPDSAEVAALLSELSMVQRAQGRLNEALATIQKAIGIREKRQTPSEDLAQELTAAAMLRLRLGQGDAALEALKRALDAWDAVAPGDPRCLPALEALANIYRDRSQYAESEPLYLSALKMREAASGPNGAELIATIDSLAYVYFGLKRYTEAGPLYKRLLALWETSASPEHPMVALTLDKMAEFYAAQGRYPEAEELVRRALSIRANMHIGSMHQAGRIYLMEAKLEEADDLYGCAIKIGDLAKVPDDVMDPLLRVYAKVLRELNRGQDADALERRVKEALLRKADREGRRPSPANAKPAGVR